MAFRIVGLPAARFSKLFDLSAAALVKRRAVRRTADASPGFPCRIGLRDADVGEEVILLNYTHQPAPTPYQSSHAIFIGQRSRDTYDRIDEVPQQLKTRTLSLRAFNATGFIVDASLVEGKALEDAIDRLLSQPEVDYIHAHFARFGCYAARIERG